MIGREMLGSGMPSSFASGVAGFGLTVAAAGSTQTDAALIQTSMAIVTGADGTKGVVLLGGVEGDEVWIVNNSASTLKVYPPTGAAISVPGTGLGSANAAFLLTGNATFHGKFESTTQVIASSTFAYSSGTWTPTVTAAVGTFTTVSANGTYTRVGDRMTVRLQILITTNGTAAQNIQFTLPPFAPAEDTPFCALESDITGFAGTGYFQQAGNKGVLLKYDGTYLGGNGYRIDVAGTYRT